MKVKFKLYYINYKKLIYINFNEVKKTNLGKNNQFLTFREHLFHAESIQILERLRKQIRLVLIKKFNLFKEKIFIFGEPYWIRTSDPFLKRDFVRTVPYN